MGRNVGEIVGIFFIYFLLFYCYRLINTFLTSFRIIEAWWILVEDKHHIGSRFKKRQPKWLTWLLCRHKLLQERIVFASKLFNSYLDHFLMTPLFFIYIFFIYKKKKKIVFWWLEYYLYFVDNEKIVISLSILWRKFWNYYFFPCFWFTRFITFFLLTNSIVIALVSFLIWLSWPPTGIGFWVCYPIYLSSVLMDLHL